MRPAREIHTLESGFRSIAVVALAVTLVVWPAGAVIVAAEPALGATGGPKADGPATTATAEVTTSTSRPPAARGPVASSLVLPLVLAALLVLALLDPPPRFYSHWYWHRY